MLLYDAANRLVKVKADNNVTVIATYTYGDSNERLIGEEAGVRTYYACHGSVEYVETGGSSTPAWSKSIRLSGWSLAFDCDAEWFRWRNDSIPSS